MKWNIARSLTILGALVLPGALSNPCLAGPSTFDADHDQAIAANPPGAALALRLADDKMQYHIGEVIPVDLSFSSTVPDTYQLWKTTGVRVDADSGDWFVVDPQEGVDDPQPNEGGAYSILGNNPVLGEKPEMISSVLNEWLRFDKPGKYRVYAVSGRVTPLHPKDHAQWGQSLRLASNIVSIEIIPADAEWASHALEQALHQLATLDPLRDTYNEETAAAHTLQFLDTPESLKAILQLVPKPDRGQAWRYSAALTESRHPDLAIADLEQRLVDPAYPVTERFLDDLVRLQAAKAAGPRPDRLPSRSLSESWGQWGGRQKWEVRCQDAWTPSRVRDLDTLFRALDQKQGLARSTSLATLCMKVLANIPKGTPRDVERHRNPLINQLVADFWNTPDEDQYILLSTPYWSQVRSPVLLPVLKRLYDRPEPVGAHEMTQDLALQKIHDLSPDEGRKLILDEIRSPRHKVRIQTYFLLPDKTLPDLEKIIALRLTRDGLDQGIIDMALIARYGTRAVLKAVHDYYGDGSEGWACAFQAPSLAYLVRVDPGTGLRLLEKALDRRGLTGCYKTVLSDVAAYEWRPEIEQMAIARLDDPDPEVVASAAKALGDHGSATAQEALWKRLEKWHDDWKGRVSEIQEGQASTSFQWGVEDSLWRALVKLQPGDHPDKATADRLRSLCLTTSALSEIAHVVVTSTNARAK